jgi:hypothetical protein
MLEELDRFGLEGYMHQAHLALRNGCQRLDKLGALFIAELSRCELVFQFRGLEFGDFEFGFRCLETFLSFGFVGALNYEQFVGRCNDCRR